MKKAIASILILTLSSPLAVMAHPGGFGGPDHSFDRHRHYRGHGPGPGPAPLHFMPYAAGAVLIGGLTYYLLNGNYYRRQGETYVVVNPPYGATAGPQLHSVDYNGERYYVADGHYYRRDISGHYLEIPRPPGL